MDGVGKMAFCIIYFSILGTYYIVLGIFAFFFNKYPHRKKTLNKLESKYGLIDEKRLAQFDGLNYFASGIILSIIGLILIRTKHISPYWIIIFLILCLLLAVAYYPLRRKYLRIK